jgi:prepilin-type N-terminal cleavage/methylation domain-containing protein
MQKYFIFNPRGFTLIEIIAVLIILSTIAALAIPKFIDLDENAKDRAIDSGISELNGRESLIWADIKVSLAGWSDDTTLFSGMDTFLGADYTWTVAASESGGHLSFKSGTPVELTRTVSTGYEPAHWRRK